MLENKIEYEKFFYISADLQIIADEEWTTKKTNRAWLDILGFSEEEMDLIKLTDLIHTDDLQASRDYFGKLHASGKLDPYISRMRCKDGTYRAIEWHSRISDGWLYASGRDVTEKKLNEEKLRNMATKDELTGLYNRYYFDTIITDLIEHSERYNEPVSFILFDFDNFKKINDTYGHQLGDDVLKMTARIAANTLRSSDIIFRFGGEEFLVVLQQTSIEGAAAAAEKLRSAIENADFPVVGVQTVSIGISERMNAESYRHWFRRTDEALYRAKHSGRNCVAASDGNEKSPLASVRIDWNPEWESKNNEIDRQHKELIDIANELFKIFLSDTSHKEILRHIELLLQHIVYHFEHEEKVLVDIGYPEHSSHANIHRHLIAKASRLKESYMKGEIKESAFFSFVVDDVVLDHMIKYDKNFFAYTKEQ